MRYFFAFIVAFLIVYILIPELKKLAIRIDFVDRPIARKIHKKPIPQLASIAIFLGFMVTYLGFTGNVSRQSVGVLIGSLMILSIGIVDDWYKTKGKEFPVLPRLVIQIGAAVIAYGSGIVFYGFTNPFTQEHIMLPVVLQCFLSVIWIFGVTTVINFIDGLDGLAGGISAISATTLFIVAMVKGQYDYAMMAIILTGVLVGYLRYNKQPAQILMGDSGATFIGYILGVIALGGAFKQATVLSVFIPILALGVPILDNIFVVIKRFLEGKAIYQADRSQVHYRLLSTGLNQRQVVAFLCLVNLCMGLMSIIILLLKV